jgi:hypothetical protein
MLPGAAVPMLLSSEQKRGNQQRESALFAAINRQNP